MKKQLILFAFLLSGTLLPCSIIAANPDAIYRENLAKIQARDERKVQEMAQRKARAQKLADTAKLQEAALIAALQAQEDSHQRHLAKQRQLDALALQAEKDKEAEAALRASLRRKLRAQQ